MIFPFEQKVFSEEETVSLAKEFSKMLRGGDVIVLNGSLGAGKTFFVRSAAEILGVSGVASPTFSIVNEYSNGKRVFHFDFYRIGSESELYEMGYDDYLNESDAVIFIEWGSLLPEVLPQKRYEVSIGYRDEHTREFRIEKFG